MASSTCGETTVWRQARQMRQEWRGQRYSAFENGLAPAVISSKASVQGLGHCRALADCPLEGTEFVEIWFTLVGR